MRRSSALQAPQDFSCSQPMKTSLPFTEAGTWTMLGFSSSRRRLREGYAASRMRCYGYSLQGGH